VSELKIRAVIVDDEELARAVLREFLNEEEDVDIVAECANGFEAVKAISELRPDLLFLDVQMPKLDGFEVLELADAPVEVIFVTAYDQFATKAFDAAAVDYLLKPFHAERFRVAVDRARRRLREKQAPGLNVTELKNASRAPDQFIQRIVVKDGTRVHVIPVEKLDYAEVQDEYVGLRSAGHTYLKQQSMASLEASLDPGRFLRIHRAFLVNIEKIAKIDQDMAGARIAVLTDGSEVPVSRSGYARFRELVGG
jgi:two-component system, LytTR family, response regulator